MKFDRSTLVALVTAVAVLVLLAAIPSALIDTFQTGRIYLFSQQFLDELPQRLTGPGKLRFLIQPLMAGLLGCRDGLHDARARRPAYLWGLLTRAAHRKELAASGWASIRALVAMGIVLDALAQLLIYRQVHPGAAVLVGPVLVGLPYALARAVANRASRLAHRSANRHR